jgi:hypothetical protein
VLTKAYYDDAVLGGEELLRLKLPLALATAVAITALTLYLGRKGAFRRLLSLPRF